MSNVFAQSRSLATDSWGLGFGLTYPRLISINDAVVQAWGFFGGHLSIQRNFSEHVGVRLRTSYNHMEATYQSHTSKSGEIVKTDMVTFDGAILYYFVPCEPWSPYLVAGAGAAFYSVENPLYAKLDGESLSDGQYSLGAGTEIRIGEAWRVKLEVLYNTVWSSNIDGNQGPSNGIIGGTANDTWVNADFGLLYYFSKGESSKICQLYTGIGGAVDYDRIEDIVGRYQTEPTEFDYNRVEDIVKRYSQRAVEDKWTLLGVNFDFNKATLRPEAYPILDNAAEILLTHPQVNVDIEGYTDQLGSDKYNDKLSLQRAESVKKYLIAKGVDSSRLNTVGKGKRDLLFKEKDPTSRFYNRRIEFKVK